MEAYRTHLLVCTGQYCSPERRGRALYALLPSLLEREELLFGDGRVKRSEVPCLGVCERGPILCLYPDGVWYERVDAALLERIVVERCRDGKAVNDRVFHRLGRGDSE